MSTDNKLIKAGDEGKFEDEYGKFEHICLVGAYYGYPGCCILHYYHNFSFETKELKCEKKCLDVGGNTGFVPCPCHADDIINKKCEIEDLIDYKLRKSYYDFPDDPDNDTLFIHFIDKYRKFIKKLFELYIVT